MSTMKRMCALTLALATLLSLFVLPSHAALYKTGSSSIDVKYLQMDLNFLGFDCGVADGKFGSRTERAVRALQANSNGTLTVDGIAGDQTIGYIYNTVIRCQLMLTELGYATGYADGIAGDKTTSALRMFQQAYGLNPSGKLDAKTCDALRTLYIRKLRNSGDSISVLQANALSTWSSPLKTSYYAVVGSRRFRTNRESGTRTHAGIDMVCKAGTTVYACNSGTVISIGNFYKGTADVAIQHADGSIVRYCEISTSLKVGDTVMRGAPIARVKRTTSGSEMLHIEAYAGTMRGQLSQSYNHTYYYVPYANYERRGDLIEPTFLMMLSPAQ